MKGFIITVIVMVTVMAGQVLFTNPYGTAMVNAGESTAAKPDEIKDSILNGLIWLARHQNPDGSWGAKTFQKQCGKKQCSSSSRGDEKYHYNIDIGLTGFALLAFTGAGYTDKSQETFKGICFGDVIKKSALYLKGIQLSNGAFGGPKEGKFMYNHAIATYALANLYRSTKDASFKEPVEQAVKYLLWAQNPGKGWRFQPGDGQSDSEVTGWATLALKTAEDCNIPIPPEAYTGIKSFYDYVTDKITGQVGYTEVGSSIILGYEDSKDKVNFPPLCTAMGTLVRLLIDRENSLIKVGVDQIISKLPTWDKSKHGSIDYFYWFFGTKCLIASDGPNGKNWNIWWKKIKDALLKNQCTEADGCADGSWDPIDRWGFVEGRVYSTAINVMTLSIV